MLCGLYDINVSSYRAQKYVSRIGGLCLCMQWRRLVTEHLRKKRLALLILIASLFNHVPELSSLRVGSTLSIFWAGDLTPATQLCEWAEIRVCILIKVNYTRTCNYAADLRRDSLLNELSCHLLNISLSNSNKGQ
jgi:hypothetical protein